MITSPKKINLLDHYRRLFFYNFNRFKGNNYALMRAYFAQILIMEIEEFMPLLNKKILDVGGAKGEFCKALSDNGKCDATNLDPCPGQYIWPNTIIGFANNLPFNDNEFDLVIGRGILEHIPTDKQQESLCEMYRVTKVAGICYILIPPWYNPHAGHSLKPFHIFPFKVAKLLRQFVFRDKISANSFQEANLYPVSFGRMLKLISTTGFKLIATRDTHFRLHFLTRIPIIREIAIPSVAFILVK